MENENVEIGSLYQIKNTEFDGLGYVSSNKIIMLTSIEQLNGVYRDGKSVWSSRGFYLSGDVAIHIFTLDQLEKVV